MKEDLITTAVESPIVDDTELDELASSSDDTPRSADPDPSFACFDLSEILDISLCGTDVSDNEDNQDNELEYEEEGIEVSAPAILHSDLTLTVMGLFEKRPRPSEAELESREPKKRYMIRQRIDEGKATFIPQQGLSTSDLWHVEYKSASNNKESMGARAVLFQSIENYRHLSSSPACGPYMESEEDVLQTTSFGEQVIVSGATPEDLAVGDVFEVLNNNPSLPHSTLKLEISSPRLPCFYVDMRHGSPKGMTGVKRYTMTNGLAGWFTRVLFMGELTDEMQLIRTKHPNPKYTLSYISKVLYGEGNKLTLARCKANWTRSEKELKELINLPQLADYEWKSEAILVLAKMHKENTERWYRESTLWNNFLVQQWISFKNRSLGGKELSMEVIGVYKGGQWSSEDSVDSEEEEVEAEKIMPRIRLKTAPHQDPKRFLDEEEGVETTEAKNDEYDSAMFHKDYGYWGDDEREFWHSYVNVPSVVEERAILFQSMDHYNQLLEHDTLGKCLQKEKILEEPTFGEQVIVQGVNASQLAVGDVFEVQDKLSNLMVEITSPRLPAHGVDQKHNSPKGLKGMKLYTKTNGLAGWFTKVLVGGELRDGMTLVRTKHPNPKFTLAYISKAMYGEGDSKELALGKAHWKRSKKELLEIIALRELADYQWKEEAIKLY